MHIFLTYKKSTQADTKVSNGAPLMELRWTILSVLLRFLKEYLVLQDGGKPDPEEVIYACIYAYQRICMHTFVALQDGAKQDPEEVMHVCMHVYMRTGIYACIHLWNCAHVNSIHTHAHTHKHTHI